MLSATWTAWLVFEELVVTDMMQPISICLGEHVSLERFGKLPTFGHPLTKSRFYIDLLPDDRSTTNSKITFK